MPRLSNCSPPVFLTGLLLLTGSVAGQAPMVPPASSPAPMIPPPTSGPTAPAPMTAAPAPAPASAVDPQAIALFKQAITAQQGLTALTATITAATTGIGTGASQTLTLAYEKPNEARIAVADSTGPIVQFVSDGKTLTVYAVKDKKYRADPVPAGANVIPAVLVQAHALLPRLIGQPEALGDLLAQPGVTASPGTPATVGGVQTDTVNVTLPAPDGSALHFAFAFGRADHLLRQIIQSAAITKAGKTQTFMHTETVTTLQTAPTLTAADFSFTPPAGVTKVAATPPAAPPTPAPAPPQTGPATAPAAPPAEPAMYDPRLVPGAKPLPLATTDLNGHPLSLSQYKGRVVLLDFWATWCGPCVGEMPNVITAFKKYHGQGFDVIGISLDQSRPALMGFIEKNKMPWRQVFDGKGWDSAVPHEFGVQSIPFGLLIGRDGQIAAVGVRGPELTTAIQEALAK